MSPDYYKILGVERTASQDDIKKAFRKLAAEHHPDKGGDPAKFKQVNTAHQVLSDDVKKARYDAFGDENLTGPPAPPPRPGRGGFGGVHFRTTMDDFDSIFAQQFDPFGVGSFRDFAKKDRPAPSPGSDIKVKVSVPMNEALAGTKREIRFERGDSRPCTQCARTRHAVTVCPTCGGNGRVIDMVGRIPSARQCRTCRGAGNVPVNQCGVCKGTTVEPVTREITITVPKGLRDGQEMRVKGLGRNGAPPGDLIVTVNIHDSVSWWARGDELFTVVEVGIRDLLKGGRVSFTVPDGRTLSVHVPAGGGYARMTDVWKNPAGQDGSLTVLFKSAQSGLSARGERLAQELLEEIEGRARPR